MALRSSWEGFLRLSLISVPVRAYNAAAPGGQSARKILTEPLSGRIFLAGEATHETLWGTVAGAWESGERAAEAVLKLIGRR